MIDSVRCEELTFVMRARARAEAAEHEIALRFHDQEIAKAGRESGVRRQAAERVVPLEIAQATGRTERQAQNMVYVASQLRDHAPLTWAAFLEGDIDAARAQQISTTISRLEREESYRLLDSRVGAFASTHTAPELKRWLRAFVQSAEADLAVERAEHEREHRNVSVDHGDDGMSWIQAYVPSHAAAAIAKRLRRQAQALGSEDPRSLAQRQADLFVSWLTTSDAAEATIESQIAVMVDAEMLAGVTDGFAVAADDSWAVPAGWIAEIAADNSFWHRMLIDPKRGDLLAHEYVGRFAPELLRKALEFRDGTCRAPGCLVPADECDMDHRQPFPDGPTAAFNLWPKCRRHHILKSLGIIRWMLADGSVRAAA